MSDVLKSNTDHTLHLLQQELNIQRKELEESLLFASLEKIFIEERIYKDRQFEQSRNMDEAVKHVDSRLDPFKAQFIREVSREDILKLMEIKMARILKFNSDKADEYIRSIKEQIAQIDDHLKHLVDYTIAWFQHLKDKYGAAYPRLTKIRNFDTIEATKVAEANEKLYINREEGFIGTGLKKDEFVCSCSDIDDIIIFYKDGKYKVVRVSDKMFVGKNILYLAVFKKNDKRTIYNVIYRDGKDGLCYIKRFAVTGVTRDKEYDLTQGKPGSRIMWFSANPNGEAERLKITFKPKPRLKTLWMEKDFSDIAIKGRQSMGNIVTKNDIHKISLKEKGGSTLGGRQVWFDWDILRLNYDGRGDFLGEFHSDDLVLVLLKNGEYYTTSFDATNHYESDILLIEKYDARKVWTVALNDADQGYPYLKRFMLEPSAKKQSVLGDNPQSTMILYSCEAYPLLQVCFGGNDAFREPLIIDAEQFIAVKGFKAKGKRITTYTVDSIAELEPLRHPENPEDNGTGNENDSVVESTQEEIQPSNSDIEDEITGQMKLF